MKTVKYKTNINCGSCIQSVTPFLNEVDSIDSWKVDIQNPDKILEVVLEDDVDAELVTQVLKEAGYSGLRLTE